MAPPTSNLPVPFSPTAPSSPSGIPSTLRGVATAIPSRVGELADRRRIAVVPLTGVIGGALRAREVTTTLTRLRKDDHTRAVVLDIDSPGGGATESEALYLAVRRLAAEKPVVAWIRGTGASGSYFLACGATRVLAFPSAIVGSIGVISYRPIIVEALRRIGAAVQVTKTGPFKDLGAPWRESTEEERAKEQALVDVIFRRFTDAVGTSRSLSEEQLRAVTTGEVWLATEAVDLGLIDGVCDEDEAIDAAQLLAGLPHRKVTRVQRRRSIGQRLGLPGAGAGAPGSHWLYELDGWLSQPMLRM